jgi:opacity protein-like surface antigen
MKRTLLSSALVAALTLPAFAGTDMAPSTGKDMKDTKQMAATQSDAGFYVAAYGGAQFDTDYGNNRQTVSGGGANISTGQEIHSGWGGVGGIKAGYNFDSHPLANFMDLRLQPAVELEALYIGDSSSADGTFAPTAGERFTTNSGDFFLNGILRFKNSSIVTPYVGAGIGLQYITTHGQIAGPGATLTGLDTSDLDFAGQALVGFDVAICNHVSLFSEYKFIDALGTDGHAGTASNITYRFKPDQIQQNLITAGVKYSF